MKDSASGRMNVMTTDFARERAARVHQIMLGHFPVNLAENPIWKAVILQPFKASRIIWELLLIILLIVDNAR
ncbi:MAG: hypothetical protein WAN58_17800 [Anaerolineales bacterium]